MLNFFQEGKPNTLIEKDADIAKYLAVSDKLCSKRRSLEENFKVLPRDTPQESREELAISLLKAKEDLRLFGISETDYQIWCIQQEKNP